MEALTVFQVGVSKEMVGKMSDAIENYRKAEKLDKDVEKLYRAKIYAESQSVPENSKDGEIIIEKPIVLNEKEVAKIDAKKLLSTFKNSQILIKNQELPPTISILPDDVILLIMEYLAEIDTPSWIQFSLCCKKLSHLGFCTSDVWRKLCFLTFPYQNYEPEVAALNGITKNQDKIVGIYDNSWYNMYRQRPFIKFNGIYISIVNYYREGGKSEGSSAWTNPIRMITYYRYLRFYKDGSVLKLLTSDEPTSIVPKINKNWKEQTNLKVYKGTWYITPEGNISIKSEGSVKNYLFIENLSIKNSSKLRKHNKLSWINYEFMDNETTELYEFDIKKEKPYIFSRVKSYKDDI
ncbi:hypothetical protein PACTADRAFT_73962 [Pachysolen tannophilus NRRL Y-2460]|uniref:F-box domain-containing protein n=1 Tax=Pachysolen tannophilus NRRL Y-2460 TaxID=669874 RepID=A0A1E4U328_PACTA|nr:hypothetical protein PACTADRAFT_73962 [Pachysolen tannophilus NRRL Y-2460]